jgi:beta-glucosidase
VLFTARVVVAQTPVPEPYRDARRPIAERVRDLLARMTPEEKFRQLFMIPGDLDDPRHDYGPGIYGLQIGARAGIPAAGAARAHAARVDSIQRWFATHSRLGIPIIPFDEALHGLMREGATVFPQAIGLAATFDSTLVSRVHAAAAREVRSRGIRHVLSPVLNLATDVRWGRTEETYGEDPLLVSTMGRAFIRAFEQAGVMTTAKHFVANVGDGGRDSYPIDVSRRALEERFFPPFRTAIQDGGSRTVMASYNSVDGDPATQSRALLSDVLRRAWRFEGLVISDAAATAGATVLHRTEASTSTATAHAFASGLDVIFQSSYPEHRAYWDAFRAGVVPDSIIDASVSRVLRAKFALGLFDDARSDIDSAAYWNGHASHRVIAREAARASLVLLQNAPRTHGESTLPFSPKVRRLAVIGTDADSVRLGGYAGPGIAPVSILQGLRERAGMRVAVRYAPGPGRTDEGTVVVPEAALSHDSSGWRVAGLRGEYWDNNTLSGAARVVRTDPAVRFGWTLYGPAPELAYDWYSARWSGVITVPRTGAQRIGIAGNDGYRLWVDDRLVVDRWFKRSAGTHLAPVKLSAGPHAIRLEYFESTGNARLSLVWDAGVARDAKRRIAEAVAAARTSDAAVVVVGIDEGEFRDRASLALPAMQSELIRAVAATGTPTTVVIIGGSAVTMTPWLDDVGAVLMAWYPGEEGGNAVADVLFGDVSPAGRLPITFPVAEGQLPLTYDHKPTGRGDDYVDLTGQPLFPFGHGLSYSSFAYDSLRIDVRDDRAGDSSRVVVSARITNVGPRAADEVVQLYVRDELTSVVQPLIALKGFTRISLATQQSATVQFTLGANELHLLDRAMRWVVEPGSFRVMIGASSKDIRLRGHFTLR